MTKKQPKKKPTKKDRIQKEIDSYKYKKVGIIKDISVGLLPGSVLGAFAVMHDGGFGVHLSILEVELGFPLSYRIPSDECEQFFKDMDVIWHRELKGKHVFLLSNSEAINSVEKVVPHTRLTEALKDKP